MQPILITVSQIKLLKLSKATLEVCFMSEKYEKKGSKKGGKIAFIVCGFVIVALIAVIVVMACRMMNNSEGGEPKRNVVISPDNVDEVIEDMAKEEFVAPGSYNVTMNNTWNFADGSSASDNAYVENSTSNTNDVYFDITLADSEEKIYSSPVIPVGSHLENIALDKELKKGSYDCVITYTLVDKEQKPLSTVRVSLTIIIEK